MNTSCPRCQGTLMERTTQKAVFEICSGCGGLLADRPEFTKFVNEMLDLVRSKIRLDHPPTTIEDQRPVMQCIECSSTMERFGYLESRHVTLDRCTPCEILFVDGDEIEAVIRLAARTKLREEEQMAQRDELAAHLASLVNATLIGRGYASLATP